MTPATRQRFFRGIKVRLECGHEAVLPSSWWRLSPALVSCLVGAAVRSGVYCREHQPPCCCQPVEILGTVRLP